MGKDPTLDYYEENARAFARSTREADMSLARQAFLSRIPAGGRILDFGCGSGRDTKAFLDLGYEAEAADGSPALCREASAYTGLEVRCMRFEDLDAEEAYDGIWACASILHLKKEVLGKVFASMARALKGEGVLYASFKYGTFEGLRRGRHFTDFTEETFAAFLASVPVFETEETWISRDVRPGRDEEKWLNLLLRKKEG